MTDESGRRWLGAVPVPARLELQVVESGRAVTVATDPFGVETVEVYPVLGR